MEATRKCFHTDPHTGTPSRSGRPVATLKAVEKICLLGLELLRGEHAGVPELAELAKLIVDVRLSWAGRGRPMPNLRWRAEPVPNTIGDLLAIRVVDVFNLRLVTRGKDD